MIQTGENNMSLINDDLIKSLCVWAEKNENKMSFSQIEKNEETYYKDRVSEENYIMEYSIRTIGDVKLALEKYGGLSEEPDMLEKLVIGLCQNRYRQNRNGFANMGRNKNEDTDKNLSESIYSF